MMQNLLYFVSTAWLLFGCQCQLRTFASSSEILRQTIVEEVDDTVVEGASEGKVVIERVVAYPWPGNSDEITLRNIGGQTIDLTGWVLTDNKGAQDQYIFGKTGCEEQAILKPGFSVILYPYSVEEPCGFDFGISFKDEVNLYNVGGTLETKASWPSTARGIAHYRTEEGLYITIPEGNETVVEILRTIPDFSLFLYALQYHNLYELLKAPNDPENLIPYVPQEPEPNYFQMIEWPWYFGYAADRSEYPEPTPPPSPPPVVPGVPEKGPYTLLAPTNQAFVNAARQMTGLQNVNVYAIIRAPEMRDILEYHILQGGYSSKYLNDNIPVMTAKGQDVMVVRDPQQIEGTIGFMDTCVDKPTPDRYTCKEQKEFGKCEEPFMISPLSANWQGGYCERTCGRCSCDKYPCVKVEFADMMATNGVVHSIDRLMFPAPIFEKEVPPPTVEEVDVVTEEFIKILQNNIGVLPALPPSLPVGLRGLSGRNL
eukprot:TRINITY_DN3161_c0_g1_i2.p1 TRINITY_DN3161_c0_g1~~TRINITY_DN3161_c0_g1_i2.p1  ORF type:complete len:484 (+),score=79.25 TRINITY_DN3161_c0_g1_i2:303-1754(+)